jgi:hypothetical protein
MHPLGAELFHVGGHTHRQVDTMKLAATFHTSADVPKN